MRHFTREVAETVNGQLAVSRIRDPACHRIFGARVHKKWSLGLATLLLIATATGPVSLGPGLSPALMAADALPPGRVGSAGPVQRGPKMPLSLNILVDQFGYRPQDPKVAVVRSPRKGFDAAHRFEPGSRYELRRVEDGSVVHGGPLKAWRQGRVQDSSGDVGWWFDFSAVEAPGAYYVVDVERGVRSPSFRIDAEVYRDVLKTAVRMFFYQRSGFAKREPYAAPCWTDEAAYIGPRQDREARHVERREDAGSARDLSGGWFDAGDTNQYVTFSARVVHQLLSAFQHHPEAFTDDFGLPESGNGIPDLIDEIRWQLDWMKKMQLPDGDSLLKLGVIDFAKASPPSSDPSPRYYVGPCSSATITAASVFAHAALVLRQFDDTAEEAKALLARSRKAWRAYQRHDKPQTDCDDQTVKAGDADSPLVWQRDMAVTAAIYLYAQTGDAQYHRFIRAHAEETEAMRGAHGGGWSRYRPQVGEALLFYTTLATADPELAGRIRQAKFAQVSDQPDVYGFDDRDLYRNHLTPEQYHWGSNTLRTETGNTNLDLMRYGVIDHDGDSYRVRALQSLHYIHGVNPLGMVYISNMYTLGATYSANEIYHVWFAPGTRYSNARQSECGPAPGYVVGGPNENAAKDGVPRKLSPPVGQPPQKAYRDWNVGWPERAYTITEPSLGHQASYVRLLAAFAGPESGGQRK